MQLSATGLNFIKQHESFRSAPYRDPGGHLTIGYGHKIQPGESFTSITHDEALQLLANDVQWAEDAVNRLVTVPLTQSMFDALVSLTFNWGPGNFGESSLLKKLNAGDYQGAAQRLSEHPITSDGQVLPGLVRRRQEESAMFLQEGIPSGPASTAAGQSQNGAGAEGDKKTWALIAVAAIALIVLAASDD